MLNGQEVKLDFKIKGIQNSSEYDGRVLLTDGNV